MNAASIFLLLLFILDFLRFVSATNDTHRSPDDQTGFGPAGIDIFMAALGELWKDSFGCTLPEYLRKSYEESKQERIQKLIEENKTDELEKAR